MNRSDFPNGSDSIRHKSWDLHPPLALHEIALAERRKKTVFGLRDLARRPKLATLPLSFFGKPRPCARGWCRMWLDVASTYCE